VILVDNGSADGSAQAIAAEFPQVILMAEQENHGFAHATNISVARARGAYVLLLNTDTLVLEHAIEKLVAFAQSHPHAGIWGGKTLFADHTLNPTSCWGRITPWSATCLASGLSKVFKRTMLFNPEGYGDWDRSTVREVDIVQGSFFLITKAFWDELCGFDAAFFMYGEEADLCARAKAKGARPTVTPDSVIVHFGGGSSRMFAHKLIYILGCRIGLINRHFPRGWKAYGRFMTRLWAAAMTLAFWAVSRVLPRFNDTAQQWRIVWQRRAEWRDGLSRPV
jgi:GT2 family glycosyltransferase